jgi:RNA polymerase sigma-70 factor (ECF subfamily)
MAPSKEMAALVARAGAAWSRWAPPSAEFALWLEERGAPAEKLHVEDLYLLFAALKGERLALAHLEREVFPVLGGSLRRVGLSDDEQVEVLQRLRVRLFTPTGKSPPRAREYSGKGPLGAWLRVVATRLGLDLQREKGAREREREEQDASMANVLSPEAAALKHRYGRPFRRR